MRRKRLESFLWSTIVVAGCVFASAQVGEATDVAPTTVVAVDFDYSPKEIALPLGETRFRLINDGVRRHNLVVFRHTDGVELASDLIRPETQTEWSLVFEQPGRYQFWCSEYSHMDRGMVGYITVE
ncbi:MAG: cupredoxin domain-containing protein [Chloroflexota bacterium]